MWLVPSTYAERSAPSMSSLPPLTNPRPQAAVRRRDVQREQRDLFAPPPSDYGMYRTSTSQAPPAPPSSAPPNYGARNENSVLFTVEALRNSVRPPPVVEDPPAEYARSREDDGVIDLQVLSEHPKSIAPVPQMFGSEVPKTFSSEVAGVLPSGDWNAFLAKPVVGRFTGKHALIAGVAALSALICSVSLYFAFRGGPPDMTQSTAALVAKPDVTEAAPSAEPSHPATAVATTETTAAAAPETPAVAANEPAAPSSDDATPVASKKGKARVKGGKHAAPAKKVHAASAPAKTAAPKAKAGKADACNCHGDFECTIRCAAKGK